jgi:hypothetical protein
MAGMAESVLSDMLQTQVEIGSISLGWMNSLTIDDINIKDQEGCDLLGIARMSATFNVNEVLNGKLTIESAQLFGVDAILKKNTPNSEANYEFIFKALSSEKNENSSPINLKVGSLIVRHANIKYDIESEPYKKGLLDPNHIYIKNAALTTTFKYDTGELLYVDIKRLNANEMSSGMVIRKLTASLNATADYAKLINLQISTAHSEICIDSVYANYKGWGKGNDCKWNLNIPRVNASIALKDFCVLDSIFANTSTSLNINTEITADQEWIRIKNVHMASNRDDIRTLFDVNIHKKDSSNFSIFSNIKDFNIEGEALNEVAILTHLDSGTVKIINRLENIGFKGRIDKQKAESALSGRIFTQCGNIDVDIDIDKNESLYGYIKTQKFNIGKLIDNKQFGNTSFGLSGTIAKSANIENSDIIIGNLTGKIDNLNYLGYEYTNIILDLFADHEGYGGELNVNDNNINMNLSGRVDTHTPTPYCDIQLILDQFNPNALSLTQHYAGDQFHINLKAELSGNDINDISGEILLDSMTIKTKGSNLSPAKLDVHINKLHNSTKEIQIDGNIIHGHINGKVDFATIAESFTNQMSKHLPSTFKKGKHIDNDISFNLVIEHSDILKHLVQKDYYIDSPIYVSGNLADKKNIFDLNITNQKFTYENTKYKNINIDCNNSEDICNAIINITRQDKQGNTYMNVSADVQNNLLNICTLWDTNGKYDRKGLPNNSSGTINAQILFEDSLGKSKHIINLNKSEVVMRDTIWTIHPSTITTFGDIYSFKNVGISHDNQHVIVNGAISDNNNDSLTIDINEIPVEYIQGVVNFHAVEFGGKLSGKANISNLYGDNPSLNANVFIDNMLFQRGRMGNANLNVNWDKAVDGVSISGIIYDAANRWTGVNGYISPAQNDILLNLQTHNTRAEFLNGFIGSIFSNISGDLNGTLSIIGPLNDVNLNGNVRADVDMTLKPTKTKYSIKGDTIKLRPYKILFDNISIYDRDNNQGVVNGIVSHTNFKDFKYDFDINLDNLLCYDEKKFNSDKFFATLYANGKLELHGEDGHPLRIAANIAPGKHSVFAYDAATPDAISNANFITFRNVNDINHQESVSVTDTTSAINSSKSDYKYEGDIYLDANLELNQNCEIKLRMDNTENGYMSTFGRGHIKARYHNKSPFKLDGTYHITEGKYRLYLQDIIYRDLIIQPESQVNFIGNPFDANIHLICHHTISSVPLNDLTTTTFSSNNKVKVVCILDITGTLENMNFKFDLNLPNVNDETKQLVRSMISTEEEMNTQIIYLLGLGRFYTNEYARMNNDNKSSQAVSSLVSSTLSGQINNMLSNAIGTDSNWNFGTGLSTGENGWDDIDVEGILSGRLLDDRLLINGNFGYRDNSITQTSNFIGDFDVRWRISETGNTYIKAYNQTNDRYFTKATLNTQGIGISYEKAFESWKDLFKNNKATKNK